MLRVPIDIPAEITINRCASKESLQYDTRKPIYITKESETHACYNLSTKLVNSSWGVSDPLSGPNCDNWPGGALKALCCSP